MRIVRSATPSDLEALGLLAESIDGNMTTMPRTREGMGQRLAQTVASFDATRTLAGDEIYMFVLEEDGEIIGTSAIYATAGHDRPFYSYKVSRITKSSPELDMRLETEILSPVNDYTGMTEVGGLYLRADRRGGGRGSILSLSRLLFLGSHRHLFGERVLAEMRGFTDENGRSPFWDAVGNRFFQLELSDADVRSAREYRFIADLLPRYPLYVNLLPDEAQAVIGVPHPGAAPAAELLKRQGFRYHGYVDIFDAGPSLDAYIDDLHLVRDRRPVTVSADHTSDRIARTLVSVGSMGAFRCATVETGMGDGTVHVDAEHRELLSVDVGDEVIAYELPSREESR